MNFLGIGIILITITTSKTVKDDVRGYEVKGYDVTKITEKKLMMTIQYVY